MKKINIGIRIDEELYKKLRLILIDKDCSIQKMVESLIKFYVYGKENRREFEERRNK